ncbi:MAG TPA: hypothetical protein VL326_15090 [Kofleriaceae bacterium]|jgi:hypothetical protein|nr:hypothetical protein [Kofleriaceae bacterium]
MMRFLFFVVLALACACTDVYDYNKTNAGEPEAANQSVKGTTDTRFIRSVYADILGRTPETYELVLQYQGTVLFRFNADEEALITSSLDGLGDSAPMRALLVNGLLHSQEVTIPAKSTVVGRDYIREQFRKLLGRDPNTYELEAFAAEWDRDPAVGPRTVIRAILASREYQSQ